MTTVGRIIVNLPPEADDEVAMLAARSMGAHLHGFPVELRRGGLPVVESPKGRWPDLTWLCHVCGDERPDDKISVYSEKAEDRGKYLDVVVDAQMTVNVRYCNDRERCKDRAPAIAESWLDIHLRKSGEQGG